MLKKAACKQLPILVLLLAVSAPTRAEFAWYQHYQRGIDHLERGEAAPARAELEEALRQRSEPGLRVPTSGARYVDYLPYLHLAIAAHIAGDDEAAKGYFALAVERGVAAESEVGRQLLEAHRGLLGSEPATGPQPPARSRSSDQKRGYADYEPKPVVLSEEEYEKVKKAVFLSCGLASDTRLAMAPWYFHYELGLELARRGDPQRALDALVAATEKGPYSRHTTRMYGMWFIDYLPYWEIAKLHVHLANWTCAADALRISELREEISPSDEEYATFQNLRQRLGIFPNP